MVNNLGKSQRGWANKEFVYLDIYGL